MRDGDTIRHNVGPIEVGAAIRTGRTMTGRPGKPKDKDDPKPLQPQPPEVEEEDGDIATPKRDRDDEAPE